MFNCSSCSTPTGPRVKPIVKVVETRDVIYTDPLDPNRAFKGTEIVREAHLCPPCAETFDA